MTASAASAASARGVECSFDLYDTELMQDPHRAYAELRAHCPVAHSDRSEGFWVLSRYEDVFAANRDTETFSSRYCLVPRHQFGPEFTERPPLTLDPPAHTAFRKLLLPGFTAKQVARWEPSIRAICRDALARFTADGTCDAAEDYAKKIPLGFTCTLMGVPREMEPQFSRWSHELVEAQEIEGVLRAAGEIGAFLREQVDQRRREPTDDLISILMDSEIDGDRLEGQALLGALVLILIAGLDTTWSALGSSLYHLASHPEDRRRLVEDPSLIPVAVEELLRFYAPVALARETTREVTIGDTTIPANEMVLLGWPAANRDPDAFEDADRVVIDRRENRHMSFGVGPHRCLGSAVARLELKVALEEWLRVIPEFELTDPGAITWTTGHTWGPRNVRVAFPVGSGPGVTDGAA